MKTSSKLLFTTLFFTLLNACHKDKDDAVIDTSYTPVTVESDWFDVDYILPKTYSIFEPQSSQQNASYILLGDSKAIMFDTGSGENDAVNGLKIKPIIDQITELPTTLILSHFHFDHNQNIGEFDSVAFPDLSFLRESVTETDVYNFTSEDLFLGNFPSSVQVTDWYPVNTDIDLGNRIIQLVNIPGHTDESVALIDKTNKLAFLGDFLYNGALFAFNNEDISSYKESVEHLISILPNDYKLYGAHGTPEIAYNQLEKLDQFLNCILTENCPPAPTVLWGYNVLVYSYQDMQLVLFQ